jgi:hypothetical protein
MNMDEIDLGFLKVWNFDKKKNDYIKDPIVMAKIEKIFATHITHFGNIRNIGVIEMPQNQFQQHNQKETELINQARAILFLTIISNNNTVIQDGNTGHSMMTSENFDVIYQNFTLDSDDVAETSGEIIRFNKGGYKLDKIHFLTPSFVPLPTHYRTDSEMLSELIYLRSNKPKVYKKIVNSTQIFMQGYYNSNHLSNKARVLLFMSAFEVIFSIPEKNQRMYFKQNIEKISKINSEKVYTNHWDGNKSNTKSLELLTKKGIWAEKFYILRNKIVHGEDVKSEDFIFEKKQRHVEIAPLFFVLAIKKQFEKSRKTFCCNYEVNWKEYTDYISSSKPKKLKAFIFETSMRKLFNKLFKKTRHIS